MSFGCFVGEVVCGGGLLCCVVVGLVVGVVWVCLLFVVFVCCFDLGFGVCCLFVC